MSLRQRLIRRTRSPYAKAFFDIAQDPLPILGVRYDVRRPEWVIFDLGSLDSCCAAHYRFVPLATDAAGLACRLMSVSVPERPTSGVAAKRRDGQ